MTTPTAFRLFKQVPRILFGRGALDRLGELLPAQGWTACVVDAVHRAGPIPARLAARNVEIFWFDAAHEPSTDQVDATAALVRATRPEAPSAILGLGGGSTMDVAKGVSVMLTNPGSARDYQGWDLVPHPAVFKLGVPSLAGSGAEASRTAVFFSGDRKFGINSDHSMFDAILLDPELLAGVPADQRFHSGMDCFIHCVEAVTGTMASPLAHAHAGKALELCEAVFLGEGSDDDLMVASYMGGCSIVNSEVGVAHALSYGLSLELGLRHGLANCIAFDVLDEFYGAHVETFRRMMARHAITLPRGVTRGLDQPAIARMVAMALRMERPLVNALGENWREVLTPERIEALYARM